MVNVEPVRVARSLELFIRRLFSRCESDGFDALVGMELSFSQTRTIFALSCSAEPVAINEIAEALGLSVAAAGRNVDQLVKLQMVERHESPTDRRVKLVSLSPAGERVAMAHTESKRAAIETFAAALAPDLRSALYGVLQSILDGDAVRPKNSEKCP